MKEALSIIIDGFRESPKQAIQEVLSLLAILACIGFLFYAWDLPEPKPGIQSAVHKAIIEKHLGVRK